MHRSHLANFQEALVHGVKVWHNHRRLLLLLLLLL
jgi:hypothetical protein